MTGGALIIVGEDYGEGSSIMQERSHAFAMKSQIWLLDPRPNLPSIVRAVEEGLRAVGGLEHPGHAGVAHPRLPRLRQLHRHGQCPADLHARATRWRTRVRDVEPHRAAARELSAGEGKDREALAGRRALHSARTSSTSSSTAMRHDIGIVMQGGMYNTALRALEVLGLADVFGDSQRAALRAQRHLSADRRGARAFCAGKRAILVVEEGQPEFIEQAVNTILRRADVQTADRRQGHAADGRRIYRRRDAGRHPRNSSRAIGPTCSTAQAAPAPHPIGSIRAKQALAGAGARAPAVVLHRLPGAADLRRHEARRARARAASRELRHRLSPVLDAAAVQHRQPTMGYGLGGAGAAAFNAVEGKRAIALMGDGGFWHNGLASSIGNAVFNKNDNVHDRRGQRLFGRDRRAGLCLVSRR